MRDFLRGERRERQGPESPFGSGRLSTWRGPRKLTDGRAGCCASFCRCGACSAAIEAVAGGICARAASAILALNTPCCPRCALPLEAPAPLCGECIDREPPFAATWAPFRYEHPLDLLESRFKFRGDLAAGRVLASLMIERALDAGLSRPDAIVAGAAARLAAARARLQPGARAREGRSRVRAEFRSKADLLRRTRGDCRADRPRCDSAASEPARCVRGFGEPSDSGTRCAHRRRDDDGRDGSRVRARVAARGGVQRVDVWALARAPARRR